MKKFDFTKLGGFPIEQERLAWMQDSYFEGILALASQVKNLGTPYILAGVVVNGVNVSDGWIYYNGDIIRFVGGQTQVNVKITDNLIALTYGNNQMQNAQSEKTAACTSLTASGSFDFPFASLVKWQVGFGQLARHALEQFQGSTADYSWDLAIVKNELTNTVHLKGTVTFNDGTYYPTQGTSASSFRGFLNLFTLPAKYVPSSDVKFSAQLSGIGLQPDLVRFGSYRDDPSNPQMPPLVLSPVLALELFISTDQSSYGFLNIRPIPLETSDAVIVTFNLTYSID